MPKDDAVAQEAREFFTQHISSNHAVDDIEALKLQLPNDPAVVSSLASRCLDGSRKAMRAGHHMEGRRLDILARQLSELARRSSP